MFEILNDLKPLPDGAPPHYLYHMGADVRNDEALIGKVVGPLYEAGFTPSVNAETTTPQQMKNMATACDQIAVRWAPWVTVNNWPENWYEMFNRLEMMFLSNHVSCPLVHIDNERWTVNAWPGEKTAEYDWLVHAYASMLQVANFRDNQVVAFAMKPNGVVYPPEVVAIANQYSEGFRRINQGAVIDVLRHWDFLKTHYNKQIYLTLASGYPVDANGVEGPWDASCTLEYDKKHNIDAARLMRAVDPAGVIVYPSKITPQWLQDVVEYTHGWQ